MPIKESLKTNSSKFNFVDATAFFTMFIFFTNVNIKLNNIFHLVTLGCIGLFMYTVVRRLLDK